MSEQIAAAPTAEGGADDEFRFGLRLIVDGLTTQLTEPVTQSGPSA